MQPFRPQEGIRPRRRIARRCALGALVLLLALEILARMTLGLGNPPLWLDHPTIEYMFAPDQDVQRFGCRFLTNAYGMRSEAFSKHKQDPRELRVMAFGDSVLNGGAVTDHEQLATTIVADRLRQVSGRPVVVGNVSAGSWGPGNWLAYARQYGFFDADMLVLVISSHDHADNPTFDINRLTHPKRRPLTALGELVHRYAWRTVRGRLVSRPPPRPTDATDIDRALADLRAFLELAIENVEQVLVFQHLERHELLRGSPDEGYESIAALCAALEVPCHSMESYFAAAVGREQAPYRDNVHPSPAGQAMIAEAILDQVSDGVAATK